MRSGLHGIDLGSLPVIREWIQSTIRQVLSSVVAPKYVIFDVVAFWNQHRRSVL